MTGLLEMLEIDTEELETAVAKVTREEELRTRYHTELMRLGYNRKDAEETMAALQRQGMFDPKTYSPAEYEQVMGTKEPAYRQAA